jgi:hypothetical protein
VLAGFLYEGVHVFYIDGSVSQHIQDAKIGRVRKGEGPDLDAGPGQRVGDLGEPPGLVLEKKAEICSTCEGKTFTPLMMSMSSVLPVTHSIR